MFGVDGIYGIVMLKLGPEGVVMFASGPEGIVILTSGPEGAEGIDGTVVLSPLELNLGAESNPSPNIIPSAIASKPRIPQSTQHQGAQKVFLT